MWKGGWFFSEKGKVVQLLALRPGVWEGRGAGVLDVDVEKPSHEFKHRTGAVDPISSTVREIPIFNVNLLKVNRFKNELQECWREMAELRLDSSVKTIQIYK